MEQHIVFRVEHANINHAVSWKENSYYLLMFAKDLKSFADAVKWCGVGGGVTRTVRTDDFMDFVRYVFENKANILSGTFDLRNITYCSRVKPVSWISKICHILNPQKYPLIFDEFVKKHLEVNTVEDFWDKLIKKRECSKNKDNIEIYKEEARIWAESITKYKK